MPSAADRFEAPSITRRFACMLYEALLLVGVVFVAGLLFGILTQTRNALDNRHGLQAFIFFVLGVYFVWFWAKGQTLAMKTWHIRLQTVTGASVSQKRALVRYMLAWLWILPPIWLASLLQANALYTLALAAIWAGVWAILGRLRSDHQFWHDAWSGTKLVYTPPRR